MATFRDVATGAQETRPFTSISINPPARTVDALKDSPGELLDSDGLVNVDPLTLRHRKYKNVFAFGDCASLDTNRNIFATAAQVNVVNQNVNQYFLGNEQNGIYNGYSWWPLLTGACEATSFSHFYNYEPHTFNNVVPKHGILSQLYFTQLQRSLVSFGTKYSGMKKNAGPPYYRAAKPWPPIEANNDYKRFKSLSPAL